MFTMIGYLQILQFPIRCLLYASAKLRDVSFCQISQALRASQKLLNPICPGWRWPNTG